MKRIISFLIYHIIQGSNWWKRFFDEFHHFSNFFHSQNQNQNQNQQKDPCVPNSICKCCNQLNSRSLKRLAPELFTSAELIARTATEIATSTLGTPAAPNNCECCEQTNSKYLRKLSTELLYLLNHIPVQDPHLHQTVQTLIQHQLMTIDNDNETHESKKQKTS